MEIQVKKVVDDPQQIDVTVTIDDAAQDGMLLILVSDNRKGKVVTTDSAVTKTRNSAYRLARKDLKLARDPRTVDVTRLSSEEAEEVMRECAQMRQVAIRHMEFTGHVANATMAGGRLLRHADRHQRFLHALRNL